MHMYAGSIKTLPRATYYEVVHKEGIRDKASEAIE